jgi:nitrogenase molybdenum-iron protein beta chain
MSHFIERPRFTCALAGALATVTALPRTIHVLHAPPGCAGNTAWTQSGGCGLQVGGYCGGISIPGSNVQEREVIFGGLERLHEQIDNTLKVMDGDLYVVLTSCVTEIIGDDVESLINSFRNDGVAIISAETGGFKGNSYLGYEIVLESILRNYVVRGAKTVKGKVNLWGIAPYFDVFWRGNLEGVRQLLGKLGLEVNTFFTVDDNLEAIRQAGAAELNIVISDVLGWQAGEASHEVHGIPYIVSSLPIGPSASDQFLRIVGKALQLSEDIVEGVITSENQRYYKLLEPITDCYNDMDLQRYVAIVGDANYSTAITQFLADDFGWIPEVIVVSDIINEEQQQRIINRLLNLKSGIRPQIVFKGDSSEIAQEIKKHWESRQTKSGKYVNPLSPAFVIGSSLDRPLAQELGAAHLSVSFPVSNRAVIDRGYTGYYGGLRLIEDIVSAIIINR